MPTIAFAVGLPIIEQDLKIIRDTYSVDARQPGSLLAYQSPNQSVVQGTWVGETEKKQSKKGKKIFCENGCRTGEIKRNRLMNPLSTTLAGCVVQSFWVV